MKAATELAVATALDKNNLVDGKTNGVERNVNDEGSRLGRLGFHQRSTSGISGFLRIKYTSMFNLKLIRSDKAPD